MNSLEARILEMLIRVRQFGLTHLSAFPNGSRGHELFEMIGGFIDFIESHSAAHAQHARAAKEKTTQKNTACDFLREGMALFVRTARAMTRIAPGVQDKFRMPSGQGVQELLATARAFEIEGELLKDELIRRGMPANFLEDFHARIEKVEQSVDGRAQKSAARVSSRVAVAEAVQNARESVRELDAVVYNVFANDASVLAEWESASHVERAPHHPEPESPPAPPESSKS